MEHHVFKAHLKLIKQFLGKVEIGKIFPTSLIDGFNLLAWIHASTEGLRWNFLFNRPLYWRHGHIRNAAIVESAFQFVALIWVWYIVVQVDLKNYKSELWRLIEHRWSVLWIWNSDLRVGAVRLDCPFRSQGSCLRSFKSYPSCIRVVIKSISLPA